MVKRWLIISVALLASLAMFGCGVPQANYEAVIAERDSLQLDLESEQSQLQSVQRELETAQSELQSVQRELETAQSELQSVRSQLSSSKSMVQAQKGKVKEALGYAQAFHIYLYPTRKYYGIQQKLDYPSNEAWLSALEISVRSTGDDELLARFRMIEEGQSGAAFLSHCAIMTMRSLQEILLDR